MILSTKPGTMWWCYSVEARITMGVDVRAEQDAIIITKRNDATGQQKQDNSRDGKTPKSRATLPVRVERSNPHHDVEDEDWDADAAHGKHPERHGTKNAATTNCYAGKE